MQWHFLGEARPVHPPREVFLTQMVASGLLMQIPEVPSARQCDGLQRCAQTGIWESRIAPDHPLALLYNRWEQQAFVEQEQPFPDPRARFLDIAMEDLRWVYLGSPNADTETPGVKRIAL